MPQSATPTTTAAARDPDAVYCKKHTRPPELAAFYPRTARTRRLFAFHAGFAFGFDEQQCERTPRSAHASPFSVARLRQLPQRLSLAFAVVDLSPNGIFLVIHYALTVDPDEIFSPLVMGMLSEDLVLQWLCTRYI